MSLLVDALTLVATLDGEVWQVTAVSLQVSFVALALALALAVPAGYALAGARSGVAQAASGVLHALAALPTVVVGLTLYFALSASGPLGWMDLLYTKAAMVAGQTILAFPILAALTLGAVRRLPPSARETVQTMGIRGVARMRVVLNEVRPALVSAALIAFARVFTELGAAVILGGNIRHHTRTLTTVIALEHTRGDDARALAMGLVLLGIALAVNAVVHGAAALRGDGE
ncbi:MAG: ABC transporter permease [Vicinamibacterales bacterium]|nr:ABC transporter permease [Vicinamibacterales bacterium]